VRIAAFAAVFLVSARAIAAEPDLKACVASYEDGQHLLHEGELRRAHEQLLVCARAPCPREMWPDCMRWLSESEQRMPSIVLGAQDADGLDATDVRVTIDGKPLAERLDSHAIDVDPGEHLLVFQRGDETIQQKIVLGEGEKRRLVRVQLHRPKEATRDSSPPPRKASGGGDGVPMATYVAGGIGVVALGAFTGFGLAGRSDYMDLEHTCSPHCSSSAATPARTKLLVADISLGVSLVAFAAATYFFFDRPVPRQRAALPIDLDVHLAQTEAFATAHVAF
jgi:hypothetical protein